MSNHIKNVLLLGLFCFVSQPASCSLRSGLSRVSAFLKKNKGKIVLSAAATALLAAMIRSQYNLEKGQGRLEEGLKGVNDELLRVYGLGQEIQGGVKDVQGKMDTLNRYVMGAVQDLAQSHRQSIVALTDVYEQKDRDAQSRISELARLYRQEKDELKREYLTSLEGVREEQRKELARLSSQTKKERKKMKAFLHQERVASEQSLKQAFEQGNKSLYERFQLLIEKLKLEQQERFEKLDAALAASKAHMESLFEDQKKWHEQDHAAMQDALERRYDEGNESLRKAFMEESERVEAFFAKELAKARREGNSELIEHIDKQKKSLRTTLRRRFEGMEKALQTTQETLLADSTAHSGQIQGRLDDMAQGGMSVASKVGDMHDVMSLQMQRGMMNNQEMLYRFFQTPIGKSMLTQVKQGGAATQNLIPRMQTGRTPGESRLEDEMSTALEPQNFSLVPAY